jgi:hypothetical protein
MTRLHRKIADPRRTGRQRVRRLPAPAAAQPAAAESEADLSSLIFYGQG